MHSENSITINAPLEEVFRVASDLVSWPRILPHYRHVRILRNVDGAAILQMAAWRRWIPIQWTSELRVDETGKEIHFHHLKAFTKGMKVVWKFENISEGVRVTIHHDLQPSIPLIGKFVAEKIIGSFFIRFIANQTLTHMKKHIETHYGA